MLTYRSLNDNELYALLAEDNEQAFTLLYQRYWKRMLYKALLKLPSDTDAEEVVQDTFIDIWNSRHRVEIQHTFHTYIAAVVRYKVMAKMAANKKTIHENVKDYAHLDLADNATEQWLNFYDLQAEIEIAIKTLPEKCQLVFRMSRETGMSNKQIAQNLDLSQKTIEAHISRALKSLRTLIGQCLTFLLLAIMFFTRL